VHVGLFAVIHSLPCTKRRFRFVVHRILIFLQQQAILRLPERVKQLGLLARAMRQARVRLPLIGLLSTDEID